VKVWGPVGGCTRVGTILCVNHPSRRQRLHPTREKLGPKTPGHDFIYTKIPSEPLRHIYGCPHSPPWPRFIAIIDSGGMARAPRQGGRCASASTRGMCSGWEEHKPTKTRHFTARARPLSASQKSLIFVVQRGAPTISGRVRKGMGGSRGNI
jgi:hypothetical protein